MQTKPIQDILKLANSLKSVFYKIYRSEFNDKLQEYKKIHGTSTDFVYLDPQEEKFRILLKKFKVKKTDYTKKLEQEKSLNLEKKYQIIEAIKSLINKNQSTQKAFSEFKNLQNQWHEIGMVPQTHIRVMWDTFNHHVERFYDFLKINKDLKDLDYKKNLEVKETLCKKAKKLLELPKVVEAFKQLQILHQQWREIGPVHPKYRNELWNRFKESTYQINIKHQAFYVNLKQQQNENLKQKILLCEKIEEICNLKNIQNIKEWNKLTKKVFTYQKNWRSIGFTPKKVNNKIYERYKLAYKTFFEKKRSFVKSIENELAENYKQKQYLISKIEELSKKKDLQKVKPNIIEIQQQWKKIGPVPYKLSNDIWNKYKDLCNLFFENLKNNKTNISVEEQNKIMEIINNDLEKIKQMKIDKNTANIVVAQKIKTFQNNFNKVTYLQPTIKVKLNKEFSKEINRLLTESKLDDKAKEIVLFAEKIRDLKLHNEFNKIRNESRHLSSQISKYENEINIWSNNLNFLNNSSESGKKIIKQYQQRIDAKQEKIDTNKEKLKYTNN